MEIFFIANIYYKNILIKFPSVVELGQIVSTLEDRIRIQSDPASWRNYLKNIGCKSKRIYS